MKWSVFVALSLCLTLGSVTNSQADVTVPAIFGNHMVIQRDTPIRIWGWAEPGERVTVTIGPDIQSDVANDKGDWSVTMKDLAVGKPYTIEIKGKNTLTFKDVLAGEVWLCSGQSNMQWAVNSANDPDLEKLSANFPNIRLITVPQVGTQTPQKNFKSEWVKCTPETVGDFSAVGYFFGRQLHQTLNVPIGLIDNAWGGSAAEAWVRRDLLEQHKEMYGPLLERWEKIESTYDHEAAMVAYNKRLDSWKVQAKKAREAGQRVPNRPRAPRNQLAGQHRPANLYNGVLKPIIGFPIRGAIWYQGETNASRAYQYRHLFPLMISSWRQEWNQGDFPFYWVQLADFRDEKQDPDGSDWAELREAQTMTLDLKNTGEAVIVDLGESHDIHPKDKQNVAKRLARLALARDYGIDIVHRSPIYKSMEVKGNKVYLTFDHAGGGLDTFDVRLPIGFSIAGEDQKFVWAKATLAGPNTNQIMVWSDEVDKPVAVRYAWADNPVANVQNKEGLPLTPFRTDDWDGVTKDAR